MKRIFGVLSLLVCFGSSGSMSSGEVIGVKETSTGYVISHPDYALRFEYGKQARTYFAPAGKSDYCVFSGIQTYRYPEKEVIWNVQARKIIPEKVNTFSSPASRKLERQADTVKVTEQYADDANKVTVTRTWIIERGKPYFVVGHSVRNEEEKDKGLYMVRTPFSVLFDYDGGTALYPQGLQPLGRPSFHGSAMTFHSYFFCPIAPWDHWTGVTSEPPLQVCWKKDTGEGMIAFIPYDAIGLVKLDKEGEYSNAFYLPAKKTEIDSFPDGDGISYHFQAGFAYLKKSSFFDGFNFYCKQFPEYSAPAVEKARGLYPAIYLSGTGHKLLDSEDFLRALKEANFKLVGCGEDDPGRTWGPYGGPDDLKELTGPTFEREYGDRIKNLKSHGFKVSLNSLFSIGIPLLLVNKDLKAPERFGPVEVPPGMQLNFSDSLARDRDGNLRFDWGRHVRPNYLLRNSWSQFVFNNVKSLIEKYGYDAYGWEDHTAGIDFSQPYEYLPFTPIEVGYKQMISTLGKLCHEQFGIPFGKNGGGLQRWTDAGAEDGGMILPCRGWSFQFFLPRKVRILPPTVFDGSAALENVVERTKVATLSGVACGVGIWVENQLDSLLFWRDYLSVQVPFVSQICSAYPFRGDPENYYQDTGKSNVMYHRTPSGAVVITAYNPDKLMKDYRFPLPEEERPKAEKYVVIEWSFEEERSGYEGAKLRSFGNKHVFSGGELEKVLDLKLKLHEQKSLVVAPYQPAICLGYTAVAPDLGLIVNKATRASMLSSELRERTFHLTLDAMAGTVSTTTLYGPRPVMLQAGEEKVEPCTGREGLESVATGWYYDEQEKATTVKISHKGKVDLQVQL